MFRYRTSYRFYTLAKIGFGAAYLWYVCDFFRIHVAIWNHLSLLLSPPENIIFSGNSGWDVFIRRFAIFLNEKPAVWAFFLASPLAVGFFFWGRYKWVQFATGLWISFSMVSLTALVGVFTSTADIWLNYVFVFYGLAALISSTKDWDQMEPGFSLDKWKADPTLASLYAWFMVLLQFSVYFFAGLNKLIDGWQPWTTGVALQNLAFDSSMHEFVRGVQIPYWLSLILSYVTLFQRLVVPFGFYFNRYRLWSVLILGSMHIGYAILMYVNIFPLVGIAALVLVLPEKINAEAGKMTKLPALALTKLRRDSQKFLVSKIAATIFSLWLVLESARLTIFKPTPWENKLMIVPAWKMFADGGVSAGGKWRVILNTPHGDVDVTEMSLRLLPHLWRDRFYVDTIFHDIAGNNTGADSLVDRLLRESETAYSEQQHQTHSDPVILGSGFDIYRRQPGFQTN